MREWQAYAGSAILFPLGGVLTALVFYLVAGWDVGAICPGSDAWCDGQTWQLVEEWLPYGMALAQVLVFLAMFLPAALLRDGW